MGVVKKINKKAVERKKDLKDVLGKINGMSADGKRNAKDILRTVITSKQTEGDWRIRACSPKKGPMLNLLNSFRAETDAPLELPFFCALHLLSGLLLKKGVTLTGPIGTVTPELWTIVLAPSGSCKTLSHNLVASSAPVNSDFPECASSAAFFDALHDAQNTQGYGLWFQDEFAQILKQIETPNSPLSEMKSYLLRAYGNDRLVRKTKKAGEIVIERPCLGILALNTVDSFVNTISLESMLDGFAQRFGMVIAKDDEERPMIDFPLYDVEEIKRQVAKFWQQISAVEIQPTYELTKGAEEFFVSAFKQLHMPEINRSFYRRIMFRAFKYALLFHVLLEKSDKEVDAEDMAYAMDLVKVHMQDMNEFLCKKSGIQNLVDIGRKAHFLIDIKKRQGSTMKPRDLISGCRQDIETAEEAQFFIDLLDFDTPPNAGAVS